MNAVGSRPGAPLGDMSAREQTVLWNFLAEMLNACGIEQMRDAIKLERVLGEFTNNLTFRDPNNYAIVFFGNPVVSQTFAWRFEGHRLSISMTVVEDHGIAITLNFIGATPADVPQRHRHAGFRLLRDEEDRAFQLIRSLDRMSLIELGRLTLDVEARIAWSGREDTLKELAGITLNQLSNGLRDGVYQILNLYTATMHEQIARAARQLGSYWAYTRRRRYKAPFRLGRQPGTGSTALFPYSRAFRFDRIR